MKRSLVALAAAAVLLATPSAVSAHNAGHIILPDGTCHEIGSFKDAPVVGKDRVPLDLVPQTPNPPFDEFGVSFVGFWQLSEIRPGPCRVPMPPTTWGTSAIPSGTSTPSSSVVDTKGETALPPAGGGRKTRQ